MQQTSPDEQDDDHPYRELAAALVASGVEADFGTRVREARQIRGMTQRQLADAVGLDASAISRLEQGSRAIRLGEAAVIADAVKSDIRQLIYGNLRDNPVLELYGAVDELEQAASQVRDATLAAEVSIDNLMTALQRPEVQKHLSTSPVDVDNVINACSYVLELLNEHDHPRLLRKLSAELLDMDEVHMTVGSDDEPDA